MRVRLLFIWLPIAAWCVAGTASAQGKENEPSLDALIAKIPQIASTDHGISPVAQELAKQLQQLSPNSIPRLIALLDSKDPAIREFVGYVIRDLDGLTEEHLDALIQARQKGNGWIPQAIARIGTPKAIAFLVDDIRRQPEQGTQVTWALAQAGEKAALPLAGLFSDPTVISDDLSITLSAIFHEMSPKGKIAVASLLKTVTNESLPKANRRGAIQVLGAIGVDAIKTIPTLKRLAQSDPADFKQVVDRAIVAMGAPDATEILLAQLPSPPSWETTLVLRDIAELRANGRGAGPVLLPLLSEDDPDIKICTARTLGYIGYTPAIAHLRRLLASQDDWRLVYVAIESLGHLKAVSAQSELREVGQAHWSPLVRNAATKAIQIIQGTETYKSRWTNDNFPIQFFEYQNLGYNSADEKTRKNIQRRFIVDAHALQAGELKKNLLPFDIVGYGENGRLVQSMQLAPSCAYRIPGGLLLGIDRGEWGGALIFKDENEAEHVLIGKNTHEIHRMPFGLIATVGLAHMMTNSGYLYLIALEPEKKPTAKRWKELPGAPIQSGVLENGDLFISCVGGDIFVSPSGEFRRVE